MVKPFEIKLDLLKSVANQVFEVVNRDENGNQVNMTIQSNGLAVDLTGHTITVVYKNPQYQVLPQTDFETQELALGKFSFLIPAQILATAGRISAEVIININGVIVTTQMFYFYVRQGIGESPDTVPIQDLPKWEDAVADLQGQINNLELGAGADGLSAYEVAVVNGYVGTEGQWLASLVGQQGEQGLQGIQGADGETGATGPAGTTDHLLLTNVGTKTHTELESDLAHITDLATSENTRNKLIERFKTDEANKSGKLGFRGNGTDQNVKIPLTLNGKYSVEFLYKTGTDGVTNRILDFRTSGGIGYINVSSSNTLTRSNGYGYVNNIKTDTVVFGVLNRLEVKGIDITCTELTLLSIYSDSSYNNGMIADLKIYDYYTGELLHHYPLNETANTPVWDTTGNGSNGTINNWAAGFSEKFYDSFVYTHRWKAWIISRNISIDAIITHDDGFVEMKIIVSPLLTSYGMVANTAVYKSAVEGVNPIFMRLADLIDLDVLGWGIVNHGTTHVNIATLLETNVPGATTEIVDCQTFLNTNGLDGNYMIYPASNGYSPKLGVLAKSLGILMGRRPSVSGVQENPPENLLAIVPIDCNSIHLADSLMLAFSALDEAVATGALVMTYNHNVKADADALADSYNNTTSLTAYTQLIERLDMLNVNTLTFKDYYAKHFQ